MKVTKRQIAAYVEAQGFNASPDSVWPRLSKAAEGGIQHVVSADNGAYYAELWGRGGSYYAVTGAGVFQMPGLEKGAKLEDALDVFLEKVVGKRQEGVPLSALRKAACDVAGAIAELEKHYVPGQPHPEPHGGPPRAPAGWKPKKPYKGQSTTERALARHFGSRTSPASPAAKAEVGKDKRSTEHSHDSGTLPHGHTQPAIHTPEGKFTKQGSTPGELGERAARGPQVGYTRNPLRAPKSRSSVTPTRAAPASKAEKQRGWTKESHKGFWEKISRAHGEAVAQSMLAEAMLSLGEPGGHTACVERMTGKVDDPHAFCAYAEHEASGHWPAEKR